MTAYHFRLIDQDREEPINGVEYLNQRDSSAFGSSFEEDAARFVPGKELEIAINTALAVGEPLLITGEPGTGKTQAAYFTAYQLGLGDVIHFQVKSDSTAKDLLYHFDTVRYFHDANLTNKGSKLDKRNYLEKRPLWVAIKSPHPRILLIDEIDKAPRDFPNDLLHELDKMQFKITETGDEIKADRKRHPIVFITSNSERRLPEPFLRRCVYHHIEFSDDLLKKAIEKHRHEYEHLDDSFIKTAMTRFLALRDRPFRKLPSTGEMLVWLRVLSTAVGHYPETLEQDLSKLPYLGVLLKDHTDLEEVRIGK